MFKKLGLNYMGSKRRLAPKILNEISKYNPNISYLYDLFGGGGAISFLAIQLPMIKKVVYNDLNSGIFELLKQVINNGVKKEYYTFYDREYFLKHKDDNTIIGGLLSTCYSFGGNQMCYLYGKDKEEDKKLLHQIIVDKDEDSLIKLENKYNIKIPNKLIFNKLSINERRLKVTGFIKKICKGNKIVKHLDIIQHLIGIQQLERIQQLKSYNLKLDLLNKSYDVVEINTPIEDTVIYLDPPYKGTGKYKYDINHKKLKEYIKKSPYKIYVSGYDNVYDLNLVTSFNHRSTLSGINNNKKVIENLYCNK